MSKPQTQISESNFMLVEKNEIARSIRKLGHKIKAVVSSNYRHTGTDGFSCVYYSRPIKPQWANKFLYHVKMLYVGLSGDYDVALFTVHSSHLIPFIKIGSCFRHRKPNLILDIRTVPVDLTNDLKSKFELFRYNLSIKLADIFSDGLTCITPMLGNTLKNKLRRLKKIGYFQTGVNFRMFNPARSNSLKTSLGLKDRFIVFYHGVLSPNRGLQNAIKAIYFSKQKIPNILFMLVGTGSAETELKNITKELDLEENVLFTGGVPFNEIPNYIMTADVGIIPLPGIDWWNVSSPIKLKEYLAMQLPIIATDIPAHRLVIKKAGGATLIKDNEPKNIAEAISAFHKNRDTAYSVKKREELYDVISYNSQAIRLIEYIHSLNN
jgi:glycosyltransferase involved in cell wall biosynthesis